MTVPFLRYVPFKEPENLRHIPSLRGIGLPEQRIVGLSDLELGGSSFDNGPNIGLIN